jgi:acyl-CoA thioesterase
LGFGAADEPRYVDPTPFDLAPIEECLEPMRSADINIGHCMELRMDPACAGWWQGAIAERGEIRGWLRLDDGSPGWDPWSLLFASDALPPATFPLGSSGWVPTLQLTSYVRSAPVGEWLRARQWCVVIDGDLVDERCELYDERGRLVANSYQLAMVRFSTSS